MKIRNRIISFLLCIPVMISAFSFDVPASALPAFAIPGDTTIADVVLGMLTGTGALPINTEWISSLESAFGSTLGTIEDFVSNGLISETGGSFFDSGLGSVIESMPEYASLGLDDLFSVGAEEAATAGVSAISGGAFLSGQTLLGMNVGAMGIGAGVLGGVGLGLIGAHVIMHWGDLMGNGAPLDSSGTVMNNLYPGGKVMRLGISNGTSQWYILSNPYYVSHVYKRGDYWWWGWDYVDTTISPEYKVINPNGSMTTGNGNWGNFSKDNSQTYNGFKKFESKEAFEAYLKGVRDGNIDPDYSTRSPDVIGPDGKTPSTWDPQEQKYIFPTIQPQFNPSQEGIKPIPLEVIKPLPSIIDEPSADPDAAKDAYHDLIDNYVIPINPPETEPGGDPDPDPGQNPYLDPDAIPEQPEYEPKQSEISETEIGEAGPYTTPDLMERFPFCLPKDILSIFSKFSAARQAPSISWRFYVEDMGIDYTFNLDLSEFDDVAELLRLLELILFVVGLAVATRYLIGG